MDRYTPDDDRGDRAIAAIEKLGGNVEKDIKEAWLTSPSWSIFQVARRSDALKDADLDLLRNFD